MKFHVVIYSGGMDSQTLLHLVRRRIYESALPATMLAVSFNYGQRHKKELDYAINETASLGIEHVIASIASLNNLRSSLTSSTIAVPEGHYEAESMRQTIVPGRNAVMLTTAAAIAESLVLDAMADRWSAPEATVYYGAHSGDHHIYPDCRPQFIEAMAMTIALSSDRRVSLEVPFMDMTKGDIVKVGLHHGVDYSKSWTCYKGEEVPCGKCGACVERAEAMAFAGIEDPLLVKGS